MSTAKLDYRGRRSEQGCWLLYFRCTLMFGERVRPGLPVINHKFRPSRKTHYGRLIPPHSNEMEIENPRGNNNSAVIFNVVWLMLCCFSINFFLVLRPRQLCFLINHVLAVINDIVQLVDPRGSVLPSPTQIISYWNNCLHKLCRLMRNQYRRGGSQTEGGPKCIFQLINGWLIYAGLYPSKPESRCSPFETDLQSRVRLLCTSNFELY